MKITEISEYKNGTFLLEFDFGKKICVGESVLRDLDLFEGKEISAAELSEINKADTLRRSKKRALYLLGERSYCRGELLQKLSKTYGSEVAQQAVEYVDKLGYIDDEDYAQRLAKYLVTKKKWGVRRAKAEMLKRGLSRELAENALSEFSDDELDEELMSLIEKKYSAKISDPDSRRKTTAALARRGYDFAAIKRCIAAVLENNPDRDTDDPDDFDEEFDVSAEYDEDQ